MCKNYNEKELTIFNKHASSPFWLDWDSDGNYFEIGSLYYQGKNIVHSIKKLINGYLVY